MIHIHYQLKIGMNDHEKPMYYLYWKPILQKNIALQSYLVVVPPKKYKVFYLTSFPFEIPRNIQYSTYFTRHKKRQ